jgi:CheY-like chemotaxis protein
MPIQSALTLVDTIAEETQRACTALPYGALGAQVAFVRALVDEVERHHPSDRRVVSLRNQLGEELARLAQLIEGGARVSPTGDTPETRPIDILVVEDEAAALRASMMVLKSFGYRCRTARDGEEALREFDREPAAIVLSDWCMPGMSGLDLCVALKRREPPPYVILATAFRDNERLLDGVRRGADDFLHKPLDIDELDARLMSASRLIRAVRAVTALNERLCAAPPA